MATYDLTEETEVYRYLTDCHPIYGQIDKVERLEEGSGGFVYRVHFVSGGHGTGLNEGRSSMIVKHAEAYAARAKQWQLDPNRMDFEYNALQFYSTPAIQRDGDVRAPEIFEYEREQRVLFMEDAGVLQSLKGWFTIDVEYETAVAIGGKLGDFLANLHNVTANDDELKAKFDGNQTAKFISGELYFGGLPATAKKHGFEDAFIAEAAEVGKHEVYNSSEVLTHGDFWTGNILVSPKSLKSSSPQLLVLDLELSKPGTAAFDVGQMAAEIYCLAAFRDVDKGMALLNAFLEGYRERRAKEGGSVDAAKVAIRIGAHLLQIMPMAWRTEVAEEKMRKEIETGVDLIRIGWEEDMVKLSGSIVRPLVN